MCPNKTRRGKRKASFFYQYVLLVASLIKNKLKLFLVMQVIFTKMFLYLQINIELFILIEELQDLFCKREDTSGTGNTQQTIVHWMTWQETSIPYGNIHLERDPGSSGWLELVLAGNGTVSISAAANLYCSTTRIYISCAAGPGRLTGMVLLHQWMSWLHYRYSWQADPYTDRAVTWRGQHVCHSIKNK